MALATINSSGVAGTTTGSSTENNREIGASLAAGSNVFTFINPTSSAIAGTIEATAGAGGAITARFPTSSDTVPFAPGDAHDDSQVTFSEVGGSSTGTLVTFKLPAFGTFYFTCANAGTAAGSLDIGTVQTTHGTSVENGNEVFLARIDN